VLFDALDANTLSAAARSFAAETVVVHSALFGLVGGLDLIPAYRLSHDSRVPGVGLRLHWRAALAGQLAGRGGVIVDLRSEGYAGLGPVPVRDDSVFVRVVSVDADGRRRALNHFNKQAKGRFTRAFLQSRPEIGSLDDLLGWAAAGGFALHVGERPAHDAPLELELVA
jgi:cytoplasmic iron level regulating protein YaaA (DUF328/UPF0246 family)